MLYPPKIYKPCSKKCGKCPPCKSFARVLKEIDLQRVSKHDIEVKNRRYMHD